MKHLQMSLLLGSLALACQTESAPREPEGLYPTGSETVSGLRVVAPDGRTFVGTSPQITALPRTEYTPDMLDLGMIAYAGKANDLTTGHLKAILQGPPPKDNLELLEGPIEPLPPPEKAGLPTVLTATASNESGEIASGHVSFTLRAGKITGSVESPAGTYQVDGIFALSCFTTDGYDDEQLETAFCQRFASLLPSP